MDYTYKGFVGIDDEDYYDWPKDICDLCKREVEVQLLTRHHLIPKSRGGSKGDFIMVCSACKDMIHQLIPNKELERKYNTLESLKNHPKVIKYIKCFRKQKNDSITIATKKRKLS